MMLCQRQNEPAQAHQCRLGNLYHQGFACNDGDAPVSLSMWVMGSRRRPPELRLKQEHNTKS